MLGPGHYLLGVVELIVLLGASWHAASLLRARLLPRFAGPPAWLAAGVIAAALLLWVAELLGTVSLFEPLTYLVGVALVALGVELYAHRAGWERGGGGAGSAEAGPGFGGPRWMTVLALAIAAIALVHFAWEAKPQLSAGMSGFDSTWYHGPFAAGFFQTGNTIDLHFIAPQFLAWFYPANGEIFHAVGMVAFGRDLLSPLLNLGWFAGCLLAAWCIGRPYRVAPWSLALAAAALSVPALSDQAGEARNDIVGIFFLLAAVAVAVNAWEGRGESERGLPSGALLVSGLAVGLAAGTKLNFLLPAAVLVLGLVAISPGGARWRALAATGLAALAGGGYWYLRNLVHTGNPLPWADILGPISLPAPDQALGGREAHSVLSYLTDSGVWSDWFLPGLHSGLWLIWPLLAAAALAGLLLTLLPGRRDQSVPRADGSVPSASSGRDRDGSVPPASRDRVLVVAGLVGLATALAWLLAPTSASGPEGMPRGFESGLRYLAPALILGLVLLPTAPALRRHLSLLSGWSPSVAPGQTDGDHTRRGGALGGSGARVWAPVAGVVVLLIAVILGYPVQRHYLEGRYADPSFTTPGLNAAFAWARDASDSRIATTSTRQYPLFGTDLSNRVAFVGTETAHGGFVAPDTCRVYREELNGLDADYVVASADRVEPGAPKYPAQVGWTESPQARVVLKVPPTVVFELSGPLDPAACP